MLVSKPYTWHDLINGKYMHIFMGNRFIATSAIIKFETIQQESLRATDQLDRFHFEQRNCFKRVFKCDDFQTFKTFQKKHQFFPKHRHSFWRPSFVAPSPRCRLLSRPQFFSASLGEKKHPLFFPLVKGHDVNCFFCVFPVLEFGLSRLSPFPEIVANEGD